MDGVLARAPAKINLMLRVGGRRPDGYHDVVSLMARVDVADTLTLAPAARTVVDCPGLEGGDTLVTRALQAFTDAVAPGVAPDGFHAVVVKRIPAGAGLGGGSSDAAAALRAANRLCGEPLSSADLHALAATIGSDVPFFLGPPSAIARGRGELVEPGPALPPVGVVLAFPGRPLATRDVYEAYQPVMANVEPAADAIPSRIGSLVELADLVANDLAPVAEELEPACRELRLALTARGAAAASVTGSGSAVFGLFADLAAAADASARLPGATWAEAATLSAS
jgi:4-diphosphocytidyl-2-C-methyl-D-erythritol kinase